MSLVLFILANIIILMGGIFFAKGCKLTGTLDQVLAAFTASITQIIVSLMAAGVLLSQLNVITVILINIVITSAAYFFYRSRKSAEITFQAISESAVQWRSNFMKSLKSEPLVILLLLLTAAEMMWQLFLAYLLPNSDWDGLFYHLVSAAAWIQNGRVSIIPYVLWSNVYPQNGELVFTWLMLFLRSDKIVDIGQLIFSLGGAVAVAGLARCMGIHRSGAIFSACLFLMTPIVLAQAVTNYVDLAFSSIFLVSFYAMVRYIQMRQLPMLFISGLAGGIALGMKSTGIAYIGVIFLMLFIFVVVRQFQKINNWKTFFSQLFLFCAPVIALGSFWYLRTWILYGNPMYPFTLAIHGITIFPGEGTVSERIMKPNTPPEMLNLPLWKQVWMSWKAEPVKTHFDQRFGGFGLPWLYLELPAMMAVGFYYLLKKRLLLLILFIPLLVIFYIQPSAWWSRYTLFIVGLGSVSFVFVVERLRNFWLRGALQFICILMIFISVGLYHTTNNFSVIKRALSLPSSERTIGNLYMPEYAFIDHIPDGSHIAIRFDRFVYPFFGAHLNNRVLMLVKENEQQFWQVLKRDKSEYLFTIKGIQFDKWAAQNPGIFTKKEESDRYNLYKINQTALEKKG